MLSFGEVCCERSGDSHPSSPSNLSPPPSITYPNINFLPLTEPSTNRRAEMLKTTPRPQCSTTDGMSGTPRTAEDQDAASASAKPPAEGTETSPFLTVLPPELRYMVYGYCFSSLPPSPRPLDEASEYRPASNLIVANSKICYETNDYENPVVRAWKRMTPQTDLLMVSSRPRAITL